MKLTRFKPTIKHLGEPCVQLDQGITVPEPKIGWTLLSPPGYRSTTCVINIGLIGDAESLEKTRNMIQKLNITTYGKNKSFLHVDFPGINKLKISLNLKWVAEIDDKELQELDRTSSFSERVSIATRIISDKIKALTDKEPSPDLLLLAYPKKIDFYCVEDAIGRRRLQRKTKFQKIIEKTRIKHKTLDQFGGTPIIKKSYQPVVLRSIIKSICMKHRTPIQILRSHTVEPYDPDKPKREDDATTFWNLIVAFFYKSNHIPWFVKGLTKDTCYIGISFFRDKEEDTNVKTALAQVFSLDAEGFVFKGDPAISDENNSPHVSKDSAKKIIQKAIDVYKRNNDDQLPKRIVVHKTSRFNEDEKCGFADGTKDVPKLDLIAFGSRDIKLVRWGEKPPIRGTVVRLPDNSILLYTFGYVPYLDAYPGPRVPSPLEILEHHGTTSMDIICQEILALTKLNWNNAKFCCKSPITIAFAKRVGEIIRDCPEDIEPQDRFKYYI